MQPSLDLLIQQVERFRARKPIYDWQPTVADQQALSRELKVVQPPPFTRPSGDVDDARRIIRDAIAEYLTMDYPTYMLLIKCSPGSGKTTLAVEAADLLAASGKRVAYAGPRHDLYLDVVAKSGDPSLWYEWLPRQADEPQTCRYTGQMDTWLQRGYAAMDFCSGVCGWDYVKQCPYHLQKARPEPIIYIQHQHVTLGHPLEFQVLFGDENPLQAFTRKWDIPSQWVLPPGMDDGEPLKEILHTLSFWCNQGRPVFGPELIEYLGGPEHVVRACQAFGVPAEVIQATTAIHSAEEADKKPYFHLFDLVPLLQREAEQEKLRQENGGQQPAASSEDYDDLSEADQASLRPTWPCRIIAADGHLSMLLRRTPNRQLIPPHLIWMDATARPAVYEALFGRPVRVIDAAPRMHGKIYQVVDRTNNKTTIGKTDKRDQAKQLARHIIEKYRYQRPTVASYKDFVENADLGADVRTAYFYAARGTNGHETADATIIIGAPRPAPYDLVQTAKMIFFDRNTAFHVNETDKLVAYQYIDPDGQGRAFPVRGYWGDPDLQAILEMMRDDEIIQIAHRGRPVNHPCDIWLVTNVPIDGLPPDELLTMRELMDAPAGVHVFRWSEVMKWANGRDSITTSDLVNELGLNYETARKYLLQIAGLPGWELTAIRTSHGGKPTNTARRSFPIAESVNNDSY